MKVRTYFFALPVLAALGGCKDNTTPKAIEESHAAHAKNNIDAMVIGYSPLKSNETSFNVDLEPLLLRESVNPKVLNNSTKNDLISYLDQTELHKIELTNEGKIYLERMRGIYTQTMSKQVGGLRDTSTFVSSDLRTHLDKFVGKTYVVNSRKIKFQKLSKPENGYQYVFIAEYKNREEEKWYLSQEATYLDQFPQGVKLNDIGLGIWRANKDGGVDKLTQNYFKFGEAFKDGELDASYMFRRFNEAKSNRERELKDPAKVSIIDLPKDKPIGYIGLIPANWKEDAVIAGAADDVRFLPEAMNSAGYQIVTLGEQMECIAASHNPKEFIEKMIEAYKAKGVEHIFIHIGTHGAKDCFVFGDPSTTKNDLYLDHLDSIYKKHPSCKFNLYSFSCHGGGNGREMRDYKEPINAPDGQVTSFLQVKEYGISQEGRIEGTLGRNNSPKVYSSYFTIFFVEYLRQGMSLGEAFRKADLDSKKLFPADPEVWKSSKEGGIQTSFFYRSIGFDVFITQNDYYADHFAISKLIHYDVSVCPRANLHLRPCKRVGIIGVEPMVFSV